MTQPAHERYRDVWSCVTPLGNIVAVWLLFGNVSDLKGGGADFESSVKQDESIFGLKHK